MVLNYAQQPPVKGEYSLAVEGWGPNNAYDHPLHGLAPRTQAQPRYRAQKQAATRIEQEEHWVAIVRGRDGRDHLRSSASLRHVKKSLLNNVLGDFDEAVKGVEPGCYGPSSAEYKGRGALQEQDAALMVVDPNTGSAPVSSRRKRARANTEGGSVPRSMERGSKNPRVQAGQDGTKKVLSIQLQDEEGLKNWYVEAFEAVQQVTCRTIAKLWIKKIEPKKQSAHPYNGGLPKEDPKDPERTKPKYWPDNIPHKEPDHIQKNQRITLLTHLIINTPHQQLVPKDKMGDVIGAAELEAQSAERKNDFPPDKWVILQHIFRVRKLQEAYLGGGQDGTTSVYVPDCSKATRLEQGEPAKDVEDVEVDVPLSNQASDEESEGTEHAGQALLTPASSTMTSPVEQQRMQAHNIVTNSTSASFSNQESDVINNHEPKRQQMSVYDESFDRSMTGQTMERRNTDGMTYTTHGLAQPSYSHVPISQPQYPIQSVHSRIDHHETQQWAEFNSEAFNRVSHMGAPVQPEHVITGYGVFGSADMGNMATISDGLPCTEDFYQSQARMEQIRRQFQQQSLAVGLVSQPPRDIPYRTASAQSTQQMNISRHNTYDHGVLQSSFYNHM